MRSACVVRTRFILNIFSGIGLGWVPGPPAPWLPPCNNVRQWLVGNWSWTKDRQFHQSTTHSFSAHRPAVLSLYASAAQTQPRFRLNTYGRRAFSVAGPMAWNSLPDFIHP